MHTPLPKSHTPFPEQADKDESDAGHARQAVGTVTVTVPSPQRHRPLAHVPIPPQISEFSSVGHGTAQLSLALYAAEHALQSWPTQKPRATDWKQLHAPATVSVHVPWPLHAIPFPPVHFETNVLV